MPLFSVIAPAYNSGRYIDRCIASVSSQSFGNWEMIVVDDGSTDDTAVKVTAHAADDQRVKLVSKENAGVSTARNVGLSVAKGEYVVFLDSDDEIPVDALRAYAEAIGTTHPDIVQGVAYRVDAEGSELAPIEVTAEMAKASSARETIQVLEFADKAPLLHYIWNKAYSRSLIERAGLSFDEDISLGEDFLFNCAALRAADSVKFIEDLVYRYVQRPSMSLTQRFRQNELSRRRRMDGAFLGLLDSFDEKASKKEFFERTVGAIAVESIRSVALPDCQLSKAEKCTFVSSFYSSEYRRYVMVYVSSPDCTMANRLVGAAFKTGNSRILVAACLACSKLKGIKK